MKSFGKAIKLGRFHQFLETKEAANKMGICTAYLSRIENGKLPATRHLIKSALRCGFITEDESKVFIQELFDRRNKASLA